MCGKASPFRAGGLKTIIALTRLSLVNAKRQFSHDRKPEAFRTSAAEPQDYLGLFANLLQSSADWQSRHPDDLQTLA